MKIGIVVQRYGADINGGAELHARYIAEHLAAHVQVEVLTTCATDYITWRNALAPGVEVVNRVQVRRFPVVRERDPDEFGRHSARVFTEMHSVADELAWLDAEGPTSTALIEHLRTNRDAFDFFLFFSVRYYHAYYGAYAVPAKAILVPTAERDGALGLSIFGPVFRGVRALMYNSFEERAQIQAVSNNHSVPGVVVGVGSDIPPQSNAMRFRQKFNLREPFAIYIGRIDENKGCGELFDYFLKYTRAFAEGLHLVLIGNPIIPVPEHPRIHHLGFVNDQDKFDALAASEMLVMPSYFESLSMVVLEAWALGKPVLANGRCDVLKGQCIRGNGGLYYDNFAEFLETLRTLDFSPSLGAALGRAGRDYFRRHYAWPVIVRKYLDMFDRLTRETSTTSVEPLPGWFARRRKTLPPADDIVARLPKGAVLEESAPAMRAQARTAHTTPEGHGAGPGPDRLVSDRPPFDQGPASQGRAEPSRAATSAEASRPASKPDAPTEAPRTKTEGTSFRARTPQAPRDRQQRGAYRRRRPTGRPPRRPGNR